jgi:hypothetical protein
LDPQNRTRLRFRPSAVARSCAAPGRSPASKRAVSAGHHAARSTSAGRSKWVSRTTWWLDGRKPHHIDTPVVGRFENGTGLFYADDTLNRTPIKVRVTWFSLDDNTAHWEQAFSDDGGNTWETN